MFELVRANKRRSMVLLGLMLGLLLLLGFVIGSALAPSILASEWDGETSANVQFRFDPTGGFVGMAIAFLIWVVQALVAYFQGDRILIRAAGGQPVDKEDCPQLINVVEEMSIAARLPKPPDVYVIDSMSLNAFAAGRDPEHASVAVTAGLLAKLDRDELQGVVAHEISHIVHRDILFMSMVGIMVGSIVLISELFLRSLWYGSASRRYRGGRGSSKGGGGAAQIILLVLAVVLAIVAPLLAYMIYFACSRRREYLADAGAAVYTRYPEGLASALEKLRGDHRPLDRASRATAPMYIAAPRGLKGPMGLRMSTHPPIEERIRILRGIAGGVSYQAYQQAWTRAGGNAAMPAAALREKAQPRREASAAPAAGEAAAKQRMRDAGDLLRKMNGFLFLACACGMRVKLPPGMKQQQVKCPRCARQLQAPLGQLAAAGAVGEVLAGQAAGGAGEAGPGGIREAKARDSEHGPLKFTLQGGGWQTVRCACGHPRQISPTQSSGLVRCNNCGRTLVIERS